MFSDTTNKQGLYQHSQWLIGADANNFPVADFTRLANIYYYRLVVEAWRADSKWKFDDSNQSNQPNATQNLVAGQAVYQIPTGALKIRRVTVKDDDGTWHDLLPIREEDIHVPIDEFEDTDALPKYYRLIGNDIELFPAPAAADVTTSNGLKVWFLREVDEFVAGDTTQTPGIATPFHHLIAVGAAFDFALAKGRQNVNFLKQEFEQGVIELRRFYARRHIGDRPQIRVRNRNRMYR